MKKYSIFLLVLVLTAALFTGCGCTRQDMGSTSIPTVLPTNEEVLPTTEASRPTTQPTVPSTVQTQPSETIDRGNGPLEDTGATDDTMPQRRIQRALPNAAK